MERKEIAHIVADVTEKLSRYADAQQDATGRRFDLSGLVVLGVLGQLMDLSELRAYLPRTTYYRYLRTLRRAGIAPLSRQARLDF